jgi:hypothetical protein
MEPNPEVRQRKTNHTEFRDRHFPTKVEDQNKNDAKFKKYKKERTSPPAASVPAARAPSASAQAPSVYI